MLPWDDIRIAAGDLLRTGYFSSKCSNSGSGYFSSKCSNSGAAAAAGVAAAEQKTVVVYP